MVGHRETGNETYALGLLEGFAALGFAVDAYLTTQHDVGLHRSHRIRPGASALRIPLSTPIMSIVNRLDLWHATYVLPPSSPCPRVVTVHDITFALFPQWFEHPVRVMLNRLVPMSIHLASRIIAISHATKRDLVRVFGVPESKVAVTYLAPRPSFSGTPTSNPREPFLLYVGNVTPRKNLDVLLHAMRHLRLRGRTAKLVIAGQVSTASSHIPSMLEHLGLGGNVVLLGYQSDADLLRLYQTCAALVHPALYEGFGLTVLEAMAQGAPIVSANTGALTEVVADAGILLPAHDPYAWADAMDRVLSDRALGRKLSDSAQLRSRDFSWKRCARETLDVYETVLRRPSGII